jgi:L-alanine-DL-glutamate epimerase-like enolase superfamily enzyme
MAREGAVSGVEVAEVRWPLVVPFTIARDTAHDIACLQLRLTDAAGRSGRAEAIGVDYAGETIATMRADIEAVRGRIEAGASREALQALLPAGGARNALDCALWDLEAKQRGVPVWRLAGLPEPAPRATAFTLGIMDEAALRATVRAHAGFSVLKVKTDRNHGLGPVRIVHEEAPRARLIVDANASWDAVDLERHAPHLAALGVALLEQPVDPRDDDCLRRLVLPVPVAADEAFIDRASLPELVGKYQVLNIKLDKTGGLTEALACAREGLAQGFRLMVGCMVGSSLSMAPATLVAQQCAFVDLDGPLLQSADCDHPIAYRDGMIGVPDPGLWG